VQDRIKYSIIGVISIFLITSVLGFVGLADFHARLLGSMAGLLSQLFGTSVLFDGELLILIKNPSSILQEPLKIHPYLPYSAIPLVLGLTAATPDRRLQLRLTIAVITIVGLLSAQTILLTGFSLIDTSTGFLHARSNSLYAGWWSMGHLIFAAWWFWTYWFPHIIKPKE